ncbi:trihelix transcription factor GTL1 isoform X2 [Amborella trichopoda]|uniref:trihelix transcription factor GTL1 isoform X2 n=1 Tax=Amborella trichopoda TaxID=13333 RepID=UPI0009C14C70|nr:trihelix transcription factor GTL1 isoform X2 [Amborella trichopoda]|eukprot:XP_020520151.1 trihelix transcription factor GTL1 isoform X2 [Amborella trichopoda]
MGIFMKFRSSIEAGMGDSNVKGPIWEHVSRKLAELGFNRSAKKCKEKFENVSKYYKKTRDSANTRQDGRSYRFFNELEALYNGGNNQFKPVETLSQQKTTVQKTNGEPNVCLNSHSSEGTSEEETLENPETHANPSASDQNRKKRKRKRSSLELMKGFCESMVEQLMHHQEELQNRLLEAVEKRDQERIAREGEWKMQEMARLNRETEIRAQEHALASDREAAIIEFLKKFTENSAENQSPTQAPDPKPEEAPSSANPTNSLALPPENHSPNPNPITEEKSDQSGVVNNGGFHLKRWPRSEVICLIRLRSNLDQRFNESGSKGSLWENISKGMAQLGYNRSAKRCKEKWENINKYFRKTKDATKSRPPDSKTCPYFHLLSNLYQKKMELSPTQKPENSSNSTATLEIERENEVERESESLRDGVQTVGERPNVLLPSIDAGDDRGAMIMTHDPETSRNLYDETVMNGKISMERMVKEMIEMPHGHGHSHQCGVPLNMGSLHASDAQEQLSQSAFMALVCKLSSSNYNTDE